MSDVIKLPVPIASAKSAGEHAQDETQRKKAWFAWGDAVLAKIGVTNRVNSARTEQELNHIVFDEYKNKIEVLAAIHDALHPASGEREQHFRGLTEATLKRILQNRFEELLKERRDVLARNMFGQKPPPHWSDKLVKTVSGSVMPLLANYALILQNAPKWKGVLGYNEFALQVAIRKPPPWGDQASDTPWSDDAESQTRIFFQRHYGLAPGVGDIGRAVQAAARRNPFHPVRDHLERLKWDGVSRLETWPQTYCGASDSPYVRAVAKRWLISGVARIYQPGAQVDHCLTLEGPQGLQKSKLLRTLAIRPDWYTDRISSIGSKDALMEIAGVWIIEIAEFDALRRAASSTSKSFLTSQYDRFRPPWGAHMIRVPRQCIFAASINPPANGRYLKDSTGNRRIWPLPCGMIDIDAFTQVVDQLWAEAVHRYKAQDPWHLETPELVALATAEQSRRLVVDAWRDPIQRWVDQQRGDIAVEDVLKHALNITPKEDQTASEKTQDATRVVNVLKEMGFYRVRTRKGDKRPNRYRRKKADE